MATRHGFGGVGLPSDEYISENGGVWADESGASRGDFSSIKHCGRAHAIFDKRISESSLDGPSIAFRSGNAARNCDKVGLHQFIGSESAIEPGRDSWQATLCTPGCSIEAQMTHSPTPGPRPPAPASEASQPPAP